MMWSRFRIRWAPRRGIPADLFRLCAFCGLGLLWLGACAPSSPRPQEDGHADRVRAGSLAGGADSGSRRFQYVYMVHGDGGYTYYDREGGRRSADGEAVAQAEEVARLSPAAEVFIFHQKPKRILGFFRTSDGAMRQYRGGRLVRTETYDRETGEDGFGAEAALFRKYASTPIPAACPPALPESGPVRVFLYFGHEIPVTSGLPYSRSRPDMGFTLASFARGLERFGGPACARAKPFSLVVLSACHGGTPAATRAIAPYASRILASPGELHLSYLDTRALARMARENPLPSDTAHGEIWARTMASESFARLRERTSTAITLSLYDAGKAAAYLETRKQAWEAPQPTRNGPALTGPQAPEPYRDCAENPSFGAGGEEAGVTVYYHAPRFGREKGKAFHSGWECPALAPGRVGGAP